MPRRSFSRLSVARDMSVEATVPVKKKRDSTAGWPMPCGADVVPVAQLLPEPLESLAIGRPCAYSSRLSPSDTVLVRKLRRCGLPAPPASAA